MRSGRADERLDILDGRLTLLGHGQDLTIAPCAPPDSARRRPAARDRALLELQLHGRQVRPRERLSAARLRDHPVRGRLADLRRYTYARERSLRVRKPRRAPRSRSGGRRDLPEPDELRVRGAARQRIDGCARLRHAPDLRCVDRVARRDRAAALRHWLAVVVSFLGVGFVAAGSGGGAVRRPRRDPPRPRRRSDLGCLLGRNRPSLQRYSPYRLSALVGFAAIVPLAITAAGQLARAGLETPSRRSPGSRSSTASCWPSSSRTSSGSRRSTRSVRPARRCMQTSSRFSAHCSRCSCSARRWAGSRSSAASSSPPGS